MMRGVNFFRPALFSCSTSRLPKKKGVPRQAIAGKVLRFEESLKRLERLASHHLSPLEALAGFAG
jgi:hypothetical protein